MRQTRTWESILSTGVFPDSEIVLNGRKVQFSLCFKIVTLIEVLRKDHSRSGLV